MVAKTGDAAIGLTIVWTLLAISAQIPKSGIKNLTPETKEALSLTTKSLAIALQVKTIENTVLLIVFCFAF